MAWDNDRLSARYLISGGMCAVANNILLIVGARAGLGMLTLTFVSFLIIGSAGYIAHTRITWRQAPNRRSYARFMTGVAIGIPITYALLALLYNKLHVPMPVAAPITTIILLIYNFLSARLAIMRRLLR